MEGIFDIKDFIIRILKKWRSIFVFAVLFGVLLGSGKYVQTIHSIKENVSNPDKELQQWKEDIKDIENSIEILQDGIYNWDDYYSNSRLMKIDSYRAERYSIVFLIKSNSQVSTVNDSSSIALAYKKMADNGMFLEKVVQKSGLDEATVKELVRVSADGGTVVIKGYTSEEIKTDAAAEVLFETIKSDFQSNYGGEYTLKKLSSGFYTGKDEELIALQDLYIANGERYISEKSSRQRVLDSMETESPVEEATYESARNGALQFGIIGCVFGVILAVIFGLLKDFMSKKLYHEKEIQKEWNLKCFASERLLNDRKKNLIDKKIEALYTGEQLQLSESEWVEYVAARILQAPDITENVYFTGSIISDEQNGRISRLVEKLKDKGIMADAGKNVVNSTDTVDELKKYSNVVLVERAGESDWVLIEEEIETLNNMNKNIAGFIMI